MDIESFREYCLSKPGTTESFPFDETTLVFKVMGKMFALCDLEETDPFTSNLKCEPDRSMQLREMYVEVQPGYHMNKKHWNTVQLDGTLELDLKMELIDHSYNLVVSGLTKKLKTELLLLHGE